jgi:hypothetical protein
VPCEPFTMGFIIAMTPAVGYTWPALLPIALAVAAKMGYDAVEDTRKLPTLNRLTRKLENTQIIQIDLQEHLSTKEKPINIEVIADQLENDRILRFERGKVTVVFKQDTRGRFGIDVLGPISMPKSELRKEGLEFARQLVQAFAADRIVRELEKTNAVVVGEQKTNDEDILLTLRRWV